MQPRIHLHRQWFELNCDVRRHVDSPGGSVSGPLNSGSPLANAALLADVDFLTGPDQTNDDAPAGDSLSKLDEILRFRFPFTRATLVQISDLRCVEGTLRLV